jgi:hypothetical protein
LSCLVLSCLGLGLGLGLIIGGFLFVSLHGCVDLER